MDDISRQAGQIIESRRDHIARELVERLYASNPEVWQKHGKAGWRKSLEDARQHVSYLVEALRLGEPAVFVDHVRWTRILYGHLRMPDDLVDRTLQFLLDVLRDLLDPQDMETAADYVIQAHMAPAPPPEKPFIHNLNAHADLARDYMSLVIQGEWRDALDRLASALDCGDNLKDIYLHVFEPCLREVGRLWHINQVSVAREHHFTQATEMIMSHLFATMQAEEQKPYRVVTTCVSRELHSVGIRMVSDFFAMDGWHTYGIGANTPEESILSAVIDQQPDVLAVSATMSYHVTAVQSLIERVKADGDWHPACLVGGFPFQAFPGLWRRIGADGTAADAQAAVGWANQWVEQRDFSFAGNTHSDE